MSPQMTCLKNLKRSWRLYTSKSKVAWSYVGIKLLGQQKKCWTLEIWVLSFKYPTLRNIMANNSRIDWVGKKVPWRQNSKSCFWKLSVKLRDWWRNRRHLPETEEKVAFRPDQFPQRIFSRPVTKSGLLFSNKGKNSGVLIKVRRKGKSKKRWNWQRKIIAACSSALTIQHCL